MGEGVTGAEIREATGVTLDELTRWCAAGVFGPGQVAHGSGQLRRYGAIDIVVAGACRRVSRALGGGPSRDGGAVAVLRQVADQVRLGRRHLRIQLDAHITVTVDVEDLDRPRPQHGTPAEAHTSVRRPGRPAATANTTDTATREAS